MAQRVDQIALGADVSQRWIDFSQWGGSGRCERIDNTRISIRAALKRWHGPIRLAVEATNTFHELLVEEAWQANIEVFIIDGYQLNHYREVLRRRAKTDPADAELLARFVAKEGDQLTPFRPRSALQQRVWRLLKRRATLVNTQQQLRQSLVDVTELKSAVDQVIRQVNELIACFERQLLALSRKLGWQQDIARCRMLPGIGVLTALALVAIYRRGVFKSRDAFIAFIGLDVRVRDSGKLRGQRKLTKKGDSEIRRLLYCAAMAAARTAAFSLQYRLLRTRGLSATASYVVIARKLARLAFALLRRQAQFDATRLRSACMAT